MPVNSTEMSLSQGLELDPVLLSALLEGTAGGMSMSGITPTPIGASKLCSSSHAIAVLVGVCGKSNGTLTLKFSERGMLHIASGLTGETEREISESNLDAIGEIGNMVAGCVKDQLVGTDYELTNISVPSLILGASYDFYYARGFHSLSVEFELPGIPPAYQRDRFFSVTLSLLRRIGA